MTSISDLIAPLQGLASSHAQRLDGSDGFEPSWHLWKAAEVHAVTIALASQRPLLVRGEPGTGKSQLARAAAAALGWRLHTATLHIRSEAQDLLYQFDAVRRLADAQAQQLHSENRYWQPQALWQALDWASAHEYGSLRQDRPEGQIPPAPRGHVVLIDEIDKAPSDVPNGLLEVLGARSFDIPGIPLRVITRCPEHCSPWPLVIITTNEERELPAAFLRRCMVLTHALAADQTYPQFLFEHGQAHFGSRRTALRPSDAHIEESLLLRAAQQLQADRERARLAQMAAPGLAEYLDLLGALHQLAPNNPEAQSVWLDKLNQYAYLKNRVEPGQDVALQQNATGLRPILGGAT